MSDRPPRKPQVALRVADLEASLRFYCDRLGFPLTARHAGGGARAAGPAGSADAAGHGSAAKVAEVAGPGGVPLLLASRRASLDRWPGVPEARRRAWVYLYHPDLPSLARDLTARAIAAGDIIHPYPGYRHLQVPDPDGYQITFWESLPATDEEILAMFRAGPERLQAALDGLSEAELDQPWEPGKWTLRELVHHVADSEMGTFPVLQMALALPGREVHTTIWDPEEFMSGLRGAERPVGPAVRLFAAAREWVLDVVRLLPDGLDRSVSWPSGYRAEVRDLLRQAGGHALHHIRQIEAARRT